MLRGRLHGKLQTLVNGTHATITILLRGYGLEDEELAVEPSHTAIISS